MSEDSGEMLDIVERGSLRLKSILGGATILVALVSTGSMEFRDVHNSIKDIYEDKLTTIDAKHQDLAGDVEANLADFKEFKRDITAELKHLQNEKDKEIEELKSELRDLLNMISELENSASRLRISYSEMKSEQTKEKENVSKEIASLTEKVSTLKDDVLKLLLKGNTK
jgi:chromosome segregation ATPase